MHMPAFAEEKTDLSSGFSAAAKAMAAKRMLHGRGRGQQTLVRMSPAVRAMLEGAKPQVQSMAEYLREAGLTVALQRLEASQR